MEITNQILNSGTQLKDRFLTYDGYSILESDKIIDKILDGANIDNICTNIITPDITQYNKTAIHKIDIKTVIEDLDYSWNIPDKYKNINVLKYVINKYIDKYKNNNDEQRYNRIIYEMSKFKQCGLYDFLKTLIYIQEVCEFNNIVKGVGRGSSVASYVLYIIGIHMIDAYKYNLDFDEFIKIEEYNNA